MLNSKILPNFKVRKKWTSILRETVNSNDEIVVIGLPQVF